MSNEQRLHQKVLKIQRCGIMAKTIALVACVSKKNKRPMVARDLYISDWFKKASAYAEKNSDKWFILSAKYGLVDLNSIIAPYDETLNNMPVSKRRTWSLKVMQELRPQLIKYGSDST
jgi:hypothetical protein